MLGGSGKKMGAHLVRRGLRIVLVRLLPQVHATIAGCQTVAYEVILEPG